MRDTRSVEQLLEDIEAYAHNVRSPELLSLVLQAAWSLQADELRSGKSALGKAVHGSDKGAAPADHVASQNNPCNVFRRT